ncbi:MAG: hypothetical protein CXT78_09705 [Thaumarchaeota archaeon]|nr:MAG: hypothetical protein CXT78_09705 [Nitrososphaerota archaeon]
MKRFDLPISETSNLFKTKIEEDNFQALLHSLDPEKLNLFRDPDKLEEVYLHNKINEFTDKKFRIHALTCAFGNSNFRKYCNNINKTINFKNSSIKERQEFVKEIASFEWGNNEQTLSFVESFDLKDFTTHDKSKILENIQILEKPETTYNSMFLYQTEVWNDAKKILSQPAGKVLLQLPTGAGKTKIAMEIITDFFNENKNSTVVWLATTSELLEQAINEFTKIWKYRGTKSITVNRVWEKNNLILQINGSKLIVAGLPKLNNFYKKDGNLKADLIVFDEAHHISAEKYNQTVENLKIIGKTKLLGLTATPARINFEETQEFAGVFDDIPPIKINTHDKYLNPINFLQKQGVLSLIRTGGDRIINITKLETILEDKEIEKLKNSSEYPRDTKIIKKIAQDQIRNKTIFEKLRSLVEEEKQIIYFGTNLEQAKLMYMLLLNFNFKVGFVWGDMLTENRIRIIEQFQKKEINCLLNFNVLVAGFDSPPIDTVFIARLTKSPNTLFQMIGRGMRGPNVREGTKFCDVYHVQDTFLEKIENYDALYDTYDDYYQREDRIE